MERSLAVRIMCFRIEIGILIYRTIIQVIADFLAERKDVMDTRTIRTLMDINALQSLGTVQGFANQNETSPSLFNTLLEEMLGSSSISSSVSSVSANILGSISSHESLQYTGNNPIFQPSSLAGLLTASNPYSAEATPNTSVDSGQYTQIIKQASEKYNLPEKLISSVIKQESNFNNSVVSHAGAEGLMQLMPGTAKFLGVKDSFDPVQNITGGAKYLRQMLNQFGGDTELALAAYNAGPGNVIKHGGIPPFKETQQYVKKVLGYLNT